MTVTKPTKLSIVANAEQQTNHRFQAYVQSVAFHMTLSKAMIGTLGLIRDFGWPLRTAASGMSWSESNGILKQLHGNGADAFVQHFRAIEARGLAVHCPSPSHQELAAMTEKQRKKWDDHRHYRLTRAGELVCELLVEAGLLPPKEGV